MFRKFCRRTSIAFVVTLATTSVALGAGNVSLPDTGKQTEKLFERLVAPPAQDKPQTPEQVRARYEAERHIDTARVALRTHDAKRGLKSIAEVRKLLEAADLMTEERRYVVGLINGLLEIENGRLDVAQGLLTETAKIAELEFGDDTPAYATAISYLAYVEANSGDPDSQSAERHARRAIEIYRAVPPSGVEHLVSFRLMRDLAIERNEIDAALGYQRDIVRAYNAALATETAEYATENLNVAKLEIRRQNFADARNALNAALEIFEKTIGSNAEQTREAADLLAKLVEHIQQGDTVAIVNKEFAELNRQAEACTGPWKKRDELKLRRQQLALVRRFPNERSSMLKNLYAMVMLHSEYSDYDEALAYAREYLELARTTSDGNENLGVVLATAGYCELKLGRDESARSYLLKARETFPTDSHEMRYSTEYLLVTVEHRAGNLSAAVDRARGAVKQLELAPATDRRSLAMSRFQVGMLLSEMPSNFQCCLAEVADIRATTLARDDVDELTDIAIRYWESVLLYRCRDERCVEAALKNHAVAQGYADCDVETRSRVALLAATCCRAWGRVDEALKLTNEVLQLTAASWEFELQSDRAKVLQLSAGIAAHAGRRDEAESLYQEAIGMISELNAPDHPAAIQWMQELADYQAGKIPSFAAADNPLRIELMP